MEIFKEWLKNSEQYYEKIDYMRMLLEVGKNETLVIRQLLKEIKYYLEIFWLIILILSLIILCIF